MTKTAPFEAWELPARMALGDLGLGFHAADPIIEDARAHCLRTGESPYEAFGDPREFAAAVVAEQPPGTLEKVDREGMTPADYLTGQLFHLSLVAIAASLLFAAIDRTLAFPATTAALAGTAVLIAALFAGYGIPQAVRAAGHPSLVKYSYLAAGVLGLLAATAYTTLPSRRLFDVPVLLLVAVAIGTLTLSVRTPKRPEPATPEQPAGADAWLTRLTGLLIGRYDVPPRRAAELTREARAHLAESGGTPEDEFGPVDEYARQVSEHEPVRKDPFWRTRAARVVGGLAAVSLGVQAFLDWSGDGVWWAALLIAVPGTLALAWMTVQTARGRD
ncbi:hypothetical protein [Actinoplanes sp. URMC 104]|uniref:hypothetical protein n=1 Tax=Actinoplanes sp. URMC 104 TaxID=3423409 RepID=UPI003F1C2BB5